MDRLKLPVLCVIGILIGSILCEGYPPGYPLHDRQRTAYACEGSYITLRCRLPGEKLRIVVANYGRFSMMVCNQDGKYEGIDLTCSAPTSMQVVKQSGPDMTLVLLNLSVQESANSVDPDETAPIGAVSSRCNGAVNCTLNANSELFGGDPCPGTNKYIQIEFFCEKDIDVNKTTPPPTEVTKAPTTPTPTTTEKEEVVMTTVVTNKPGSTEKQQDKRMCRSRELASVFWPKSPRGKLTKRQCPHGKLGTATWECGIDGHWVGQPDLTDCVSPWMAEIQDLLDNNGPAEKAVSKLNRQMRGRALAVGDLKKATSSVLPSLVSKMKGQINPNLPLSKKKEKIHAFNKDLVKTGSSLLSQQQQDSWKDLSPRERKKSATSLIVCMEQMAIEVSTAMTTFDTVSSSEQNIVMEVSILRMATSKETALKLPRIPYEMTQNGNFSLPLGGFEGISDADDATVTYLFYNNLENLMSPTDLNTTTAGDGPTVTYHSINSNIISASVFKHTTTAGSPQDHVKLKSPMNFTMSNIKKLDGGVPLCSYWKYNRSSLIGEWSQDGCRVIETADQYTTCQCDHLTNFAVLLSVADTEISRIHQMSLQAITYVGCTISIICLLMCFISFTIFRNLQSDRNTIHKNLVLCLMVAELLFLFGIGQTESKVVCTVIAAFLHFFFLASFSWMCLEGIQLYFMLIEVFEAERSRVRWFYAFGYGVPLLIVAISAGVDHTSYGTDRHCWLSTDNYFILSFVIPAAIVILINIAMLSIAVFMMCRHAGVTASSIQSRQKGKLEKMGKDRINNGKYSIASDTSEKSHLEMPTWLKGSAVLVVLLGLTWTFGFLYVGESTIVMAYIFTILNSLQGLFIFIFHCFMDRKVKKEWRRAVYKAKWLPLCCRVNIGGYDASLSTPPSSSSGPQNYFLRFWSSRKRKRSTSSSGNTKNRRSDLDSFLRSDTSSGCTTGTGVNRYSNQSDKLLPNGGNVYTAMPTHYEGGVTGDLSVIDGSVVDSEYVTEYCQQNMQVSKEERRYSSGSEDDFNKDDNVSRDSVSRNRLSYLSADSATRINSEFTSDNEEGRSNLAVLDDIDGGEKKALVKKNGVLKSDSDRQLLNDILTLYGNTKVQNGNSVSTEGLSAMSGLDSGKASKTKSAPDLKNQTLTPLPTSPDQNQSSERLIGSLPDLSTIGEEEVDTDSNPCSRSATIERKE